MGGGGGHFTSDRGGGGDNEEKMMVAYQILVTLVFQLTKLRRNYEHDNVTVSIPR